MKLSIAFAAVAVFLLSKNTNGAEVVKQHEHEGIPMQTRAQPEPLGWRAPVVDKKLPTQKFVQVTVARPHKKTEVHVVKVQLENAFSTAKPSTEATTRQNDSSNGSPNPAAGAEKLKSESGNSAHHHQTQNGREETHVEKHRVKQLVVSQTHMKGSESESHGLPKHNQKYHKHKHHHHQKAGNENEQAAGSSSASTLRSRSSSRSSSGHGFAGEDLMENVSSEELRGDAASDIFEPEFDGMVNNQSYDETLIEEEARQVSTAAMTQLADSSPFRLDTSKALAFAAVVAGTVVGITGVLVAMFGLHRHLVESTEHELESDLQDPEARQINGSNVQENSSTATGEFSVPASTHSVPDVEEAKEEESDVEEEGVFANA
ncbi:hypothetical protein FI667_g4656, partial [Globisporangium splendens]